MSCGNFLVFHLFYFRLIAGCGSSSQVPWLRAEGPSNDFRGTASTHRLQIRAQRGRWMLRLDVKARFGRKSKSNHSCTGMQTGLLRHPLGTLLGGVCGEKAAISSPKRPHRPTPDFYPRHISPDFREHTRIRQLGMHHICVSNCCMGPLHGFHGLWVILGTGGRR